MTRDPRMIHYGQTSCSKRKHVFFFIFRFIQYDQVQDESFQDMVSYLSLVNSIRIWYKVRQVILKSLFQCVRTYGIAKDMNSLASPSCSFIWRCSAFSKYQQVASHHRQESSRLCTSHSQCAEDV